MFTHARKLNFRYFSNQGFSLPRVYGEEVPEFYIGGTFLYYTLPFLLERCGTWWHIPLTAKLRRQKQVGLYAYITTSRTAGAI